MVAFPSIPSKATEIGQKVGMRLLSYCWESTKTAILASCFSLKALTKALCYCKTVVSSSDFACILKKKKEFLLFFLF